MSASLLEVVEHYQKKVEKYNDEDKILHCFDKLDRLPITVQVLSQTGVGKTVNAFRRDPGPVGIKSRELVSKWKQIFKENERLEHEINTLNPQNHGDDSKRRKGDRVSVKQERNRSPSPAGSEESDKLEIDEVAVKREPPDDEDDYDGQRNSRTDADRVKVKHERREEDDKERRKTLNKGLNGVRVQQEHSDDEDSDPDERRKRDAVDRIRVKQEKEVEHERERRRADAGETSHKGKDKHRSRMKDDRERHDGESKSSHKSSSSSREKSHRRGDSESNKESSKSRKEGHRKEHKHKVKEEASMDEGECSLAVVKTEPSTNGEKHRDKGREKHRDKHKKDSKDRDKSHSKSEKHSSSQSSDSKHPSSSQETGSIKDRSSNSPEKPSPPPPSKHKHKQYDLSSLEHHHNSSSSSKHNHAEGDSSREERKSKHKSSKKDKHRSEDAAKKSSRPAPALKEVDFLALPGGSAGSDEDNPGASFADALGGIESPKKKKKKKKSSKPSTSTSSGLSNSSSDVAPRAWNETRDTEMAPPPPPPIEVLDAMPEIPAYRPLPRPPVQPARSTAKRLMEEEEALANVLHNKNKRSKVYSGNKGTGLSRLPTLIEIAIRSLQENIDYLEYTGGVPYDILRPVLDRCTASQLHNIEYYNPYLMEDTDQLWEALVKKDFKTAKRQEMETWRDMHARCSEERELKYNKLCSSIESKRKESLATSRKTKVAFEHTVAKPPRNVARKQALNGTAIPVTMPTPSSQLAGGVRGPRPAPGVDPTSRPAGQQRTAAPPKKKAPLMAKVLRAMGRR